MFVKINGLMTGSLKLPKALFKIMSRSSTLRNSLFMPSM